jgi:hypothetical protein
MEHLLFDFFYFLNPESPQFQAHLNDLAQFNANKLKQFLSIARKQYYEQLNEELLKTPQNKQAIQKIVEDQKTVLWCLLLKTIEKIVEESETLGFQASVDMIDSIMDDLKPPVGMKIATEQTISSGFSDYKTPNDEKVQMHMESLYKMHFCGDPNNRIDYSDRNMEAILKFRLICQEKMKIGLKETL